jgi:hypothetical protein
MIVLVKEYAAWRPATASNSVLGGAPPAGRSPPSGVLRSACWNPWSRHGPASAKSVEEDAKEAGVAHLEARIDLLQARAHDARDESEQETADSRNDGEAKVQEADRDERHDQVTRGAQGGLHRRNGRACLGESVGAVRQVRRGPRSNELVAHARKEEQRARSDRKLEPPRHAARADAQERLESGDAQHQRAHGEGRAEA